MQLASPSKSLVASPSFSNLSFISSLSIDLLINVQLTSVFMTLAVTRNLILSLCTSVLSNVLLVAGPHFLLVIILIVFLHQLYP